MARTTTEIERPELRKVPLSDRLGIFDQRVIDLERAKAQLLQDAEESLRNGIRQLGEVGGLERSENPDFLLRQPLVIPDVDSGYREQLPEPLKQLLLELQVAAEPALDEPPSGVELWANLPGRSGDRIMLGAMIDGQQVFGVAMFCRFSSIFENRFSIRPLTDSQIITFKGFSNNRFAEAVDGLKAVNGADPATQLSVGLGVLKMVADLRQPAPTPQL